MSLIPQSVLEGSEDVGTTAQRPTSPSDGDLYFDTTLALPIWWDDAASVWIDSLGRDITDGLLDISGEGTPVDGAAGTGAGVVGPGCQYVDTTNAVIYINTGTQLSPLWIVLGTQY